MALYYNLAKVYALSDNDPEFVTQIVTLFAAETPVNLTEVKEGIKNKNHKHVHAYANKIKPSLDLLGLKVAFEEILQVEAWAEIEGKKKEIKETFRSIKHQVRNAIKELKKDFDL